MYYRCCQHNVAFGWPYFGEHLWLATSDNGLAAALYAPCEVKAKVGDSSEVRIVEDTRYPFGDSIELTVRTKQAARFPLYLRIPGWAEKAVLSVNGQVQPVESSSRTLRRHQPNLERRRSGAA